MTSGTAKGQSSYLIKYVRFRCHVAISPVNAPVGQAEGPRLDERSGSGAADPHAAAPAAVHLKLRLAAERIPVDVLAKVGLFVVVLRYPTITVHMSVITSTWI